MDKVTLPTNAPRKTQPSSFNRPPEICRKKPCGGFLEEWQRRPMEHMHSTRLSAIWTKLQQPRCPTSESWKLFDVTPKWIFKILPGPAPPRIQLCYSRLRLWVISTYTPHTCRAQNKSPERLTIFKHWQMSSISIPKCSIFAMQLTRQACFTEPRPFFANKRMFQPPTTRRSPLTVAGKIKKHTTFLAYAALASWIQRKAHSGLPNMQNINLQLPIKHLCER